jgi:hypothetical protein
MFNFANRETVTFLAIILSIAATYYLFTEMKRQKEDINNIKSFVSHKLARSPAHDAKKQPKVDTSEEVEEIEEEEED